MRALLALLLAGVSGFCVAGSVNEAIDEFAFAVPIEGTAGEPFYRLAVPAPVYEGAAFADLRDLRVYNGGGEIVPHAFRSIDPTSKKSEPVALPLFPLTGPSGASTDDLDLSVDRAGERVSIRMNMRGNKRAGKVLLGYLVDASKLKSPLSGLRFSWGAQGADHLTTVRIEAGNDLRNWTTLASDVPVGRLSHGGQRLERDSVEFRHQRSDFLRITWQEPGRAIELAGVQGLLPEQWEQADRMWKETTATPDAAAAGDYVFDLCCIFPVDRLEFRLPQENTVAALQVFSRNEPKEKWVGVASTVAYRIRQNGHEVTSAPLSVSPNTHRYWLLRADTKAGGIGAGALGVRAGWSPRELVFNARGSAPFRLAYGNPRADSNATSVDSLVPGLRSDQEPKIGLVGTGAPEKLAGKAATGLSPADRKKWSLWAALVAAVVVLGWMAWKLSRQMQAGKP